MIRDIDALVFSLHHADGVYALLLGSGVSHSAQIPTGWAVTGDLISKVAKIQGEGITGNPQDWYQQRTGKEPDYSNLLEELATTPAERQALLRQYFEPTEDERAEGIKAPTKAHRAIARLVANGRVRVILTTNFDRLLEQALEHEGITPTVLSSPGDFKGAPPLVHSRLTVVKIHGDYLDQRIKNTTKELSRYNQDLKRLLRQVFDEFGLIICGWSADWDLALRESLLACKNQRYTTFWAAYRDQLTDAARRLIELRRARLLRIEGADEFFESVAERLEALSEFDRPHPISKEIAVAQLKKYLPEERHRIRLHDLVQAETERVKAQLTWERFPIDPTFAFNTESLAERLQQYEAIIETLEALIAVGVYWSNEDQLELWVKVLERVGTQQAQGHSLVAWERLQSYPLTRLLYSAGIAALAAKKYSALWKLLTRPIVSVSSYGPDPILIHAKPACIDSDTLQKIREKQVYVPGSELLFESLRESFLGLIPDNSKWEELFDRFEYLAALAALKRVGGFYLGRFGYKSMHGHNNNWPGALVAEEIKDSGENWHPFREGFFDGSWDELKEAIKEVNAEATKIF